MQKRKKANDATSNATNVLLRTLIDKLPDFVYVKDRESRFLINNLAHAKVLGAAHPDDVVGKTDFDCFPKELAERYFADEQALMESGQTLNREEPVVDKITGKTRWLQTTKLPLRDADGTVTGLVGISRDVTKHKRMEEALARAHSQLQAMLDNIPDRIYFKDLESQFVKCNRAVARRLGVSDTEQIIGKKDSDFYSPDKAREFLEDEQRVIRTGEPLVNKLERVARSADEVSWTSVTKVALRDADGKVIGLVGISRDITEQKQAEEALRRSRDELEQRIAERTAELTQERRLLRTLIDNLPDAVYAKDNSGRKTLVNPADLKNLRCKTEAEAIGKSDFDMFPREIAEKFNADDQAVLRGEQVLNREEFLFDQDGRQRWLLTSKLPLRNQNNEIVGLVGIGRDITRQKQAEEALRGRNEYLTALQETMLDIASQLDLERLLENIVRRAGQLMGTSTGFLELLESGDDHLTPKIALGVLATEARRHQLRKGEGLNGKVWLSGQPMCVEDYDAWDGRAKGHEKSLIRSIIAVPLQSGSNFIGVLGLAHEKESNRSFRLEDAHQLGQFARFATIAIENARLYSTIQRELAERSRTDQALAMERRLLRTLIDNLPDAVYAKDTAGRKTLINPADLKNLGCTIEAEALGKTDFDMFPREIAEKFVADDEKVIRGEPVLNREEFFFDPDGRQHWLLTSKLPLRNQNDEIIGLVGIGRDITKQKEAEAVLLRSHDELEQRVTERTRELSEKNTELASANEARAQAQRLLQALMDHIPDWIYFKDAQSRFLKCSRTHARRLGVEAEQVVGKTDFDFLPEDVAREFHADEQRIIRTGEPLVNKVEKKARSGGEPMWTSTTKVPMRDENGTIVGLVGVNRDITERILAEEALRHTHDELEQRVAERTGELTRSNAAMQQQIGERERAEQALARERLLLRTLIDNIPDAIYAKDEACRKILVNPADLKNLRCLTEAEAIGKTDFDMFPREIAEKFYADDQKVLHGEPVLNREEYFFDQESQQHWLLTSKLPLRNRDGRIMGLVGIGRDITEVKEAERKLASLHGQLMQASRQAGMAEVATGVLHNVGNVLNSVNVSAELITEHLRTSRITGVTKLAKLIREHEGDLVRFLTADERGRSVPTYLEELAGFLVSERDDLQEEVKKLVINVEHIKEIVSAQQNYAGLSGVVEAVVLPDLVEDALKIHGAAFARHGVTVVKEFEPLPAVPTDKHKVLQIVVNLLHNAKYACDASTNPRKDVIVRLKAAEGNRVRIVIADTGIGIAEENLTRIFSHGFTTRKNGHGFGLHSGALSAKEIGGSLSAHSDGPGKGATFTLELPMGAKPDSSGAEAGS